jgi:hypothetical protein
MAGENNRTTIQTECQGFTGRMPAPCLMVIFGASGDLTGRSLMPSLFELALKGLLPERFAVLGFAQQNWSEDEFRARMRESVKSHSDLDPGHWDEFARRLHYLPGDFTREQDYHGLNRRIGEIRRDAELPDNVFFHLAAPPSFFGTIADKLAAVGLSRGESGWRRLVIEKPFGADRASARELHKQLQAVFDEKQIYRIDHFLGKETVQNMLVFRFANPSFEPIWNHRFIDHVQITVAEELGIGTRGVFYEKTGEVRDMIQNHLLQLLCMTAIEPPVAYNPQSLRDETVKVLRAIHPPQPDGCVCGQYGPGLFVLGGYRPGDLRRPHGVRGRGALPALLGLLSSRGQYLSAVRYSARFDFYGNHWRVRPGHRRFPAGGDLIDTCFDHALIPACRPPTRSCSIFCGRNKRGRIVFKVVSPTHVPSSALMPVIDEFQCQSRAGHLGAAWEHALQADRPVVLEAYTDPNVPPLPPHITLDQARAYLSSLFKGDVDTKGIVSHSVREFVETLIPHKD